MLALLSGSLEFSKLVSFPFHLLDALLHEQDLLAACVVGSEIRLGAWRGMEMRGLWDVRTLFSSSSASSTMLSAVSGETVGSSTSAMAVRGADMWRGVVLVVRTWWLAGESSEVLCARESALSERQKEAPS